MAPTLFTKAQCYVGTPYVAGEFDCADLAERVQRELFGREVALPVNRPRPAGARGQSRAIMRLRDTLADQVTVFDTGHAVLLWEPEDMAPTLPTSCGSLPPEGAVSPWDGPAAKQPAQQWRLWHIGTVFMFDAEIWVLHNSAKLGSAALHRLTDLQRWGMRLDGFYAWRVAA